MKTMKLSEFAKKSKYLNWRETDQHDIALSMEFDQFLNLEEQDSVQFDGSQFEIPVKVIDVIENEKIIYDSILATKSRNLVVELINVWSENDRLVIRLKKKGTGFYTKWTVQPTEYEWDFNKDDLKKPTLDSVKASAKTKNKGRKK